MLNKHPIMCEGPLSLAALSSNNISGAQSESGSGCQIAGLLGLQFSGLLLFFSSLIWLLMVRSLRHTHTTHTLRKHVNPASFHMTFLLPG